MNLKRGTTVGLISNFGRTGQRSRHRICRVINTARESIECAVLRADEESLEEFTRNQIAEIHFESVRVRHTYGGALIGALIGGGLFAAAAMGQGAEAGSAALFSAYGGIIGGAVGTQAGPGSKLITKHGTVIFRSRADQKLSDGDI